VPRTHGRKRSVIGALGLQEIVAAVSVEGALDTDVFAGFVRQVLVPALGPGDLGLWDTLHVPPASCLEPAVQAAPGQVIFLPASSPDFSPLEPCGSKGKTCRRGAAARTRRRLETALQSALLTLRPEDIRGWVTHCGYLVPSE